MLKTTTASILLPIVVLSVPPQNDAHRGGIMTPDGLFIPYDQIRYHTIGSDGQTRFIPPYHPHPCHIHSIPYPNACHSHLTTTTQPSYFPHQREPVLGVPISLSSSQFFLHDSESSPQPPQPLQPLQQFVLPVRSRRYRTASRPNRPYRRLPTPSESSESQSCTDSSSCSEPVSSSLPTFSSLPSPSPSERSSSIQTIKVPNSSTKRSTKVETRKKEKDWNEVVDIEGLEKVEGIVEPIVIMDQDVSEGLEKPYFIDDLKKEGREGDEDEDGEDGDAFYDVEEGEEESDDEWFDSVEVITNESQRKKKVTKKPSLAKDEHSTTVFDKMQRPVELQSMLFEGLNMVTGTVGNAIRSTVGFMKAMKPEKKEVRRRPTIRLQSTKGTIIDLVELFKGVNRAYADLESSTHAFVEKLIRNGNQYHDLGRRNFDFKKLAKTAKPLMSNAQAALIRFRNVLQTAGEKLASSSYKDYVGSMPNVDSMLVYASRCKKMFEIFEPIFDDRQPFIVARTRQQDGTIFEQTKCLTLVHRKCLPPWIKTPEEKRKAIDTLRYFQLWRGLIPKRRSILSLIFGFEDSLRT